MVNPATLSYYSWFVPLFPLAGFLVNSLFSRYLKGSRAGYIASFSVGMSFLYSLILFFIVRNDHQFAYTLNLFSFIRTAGFSVPFEFLVDALSVTMMLIVTGVGLLIHGYSIGYMKEDERFNEFFAQMNLFTFSMLLLVMGANYLILFIGWEGVGLCSYLLIGFWYKQADYNLAARKAFVMNRIGDLGFILGIFLLFVTFGSLNFHEIFSRLEGVRSGTLTISLITLFLLIGALGKSAQIPLYTWLPDAMAGPTPVSALIHAATMVTAGVYMIARSSALYVLAPFTMTLIVIIGLATALLAAVIALYQNDIKKVLAYSTVSQLGYMFLALGLGAFSSAVFHLTTHAFFKALLFLAAGSVIHALHGEQDIRKMGGLKPYIPYTFWVFLVGTLAISGIPPFSGFFSKDEILVQAWMLNPVLYILALFGALLTCFYMFRLLFLTFGGESRWKPFTGSPHESPAVMVIPLVLLAVLSFSGGFVNIPELFGGSGAFSRMLAPVLSATAEQHILSHHTEWILLIISLLLLAGSITLGWIIFVKMSRVPGPDGLIRPWYNRIVFRKFYVDEAYHYLFVRPYEYLSSTLFEKLERIVINRIVNFTGNLAFEAGALVRRLQNGSISFYAFAMVAGILFFFILNLIIA